MPDSFSPKILLLDLMDYKNMDEPVSKGLKLFGHIDILINNAGVSYRGEISSTQIQVDERVMAVNYFGQVALIKGENNWVFLAHLSQRLKRAFLIKICLLSVRRCSRCWLHCCCCLKLFTFSSSSPEPLGQFQPNLAQSILG